MILCLLGNVSNIFILLRCHKQKFISHPCFYQNKRRKSKHINIIFCYLIVLKLNVDNALVRLKCHKMTKVAQLVFTIQLGHIFWMQPRNCTVKQLLTGNSIFLYLLSKFLWPCLFLLFLIIQTELYVFFWYSLYKTMKANLFDHTGLHINWQFLTFLFDKLVLVHFGEIGAFHLPHYLHTNVTSVPTFKHHLHRQLRKSRRCMAFL